MPAIHDAAHKAVLHERRQYLTVACYSSIGVIQVVCTAAHLQATRQNLSGIPGSSWCGRGSETRRSGTGSG